MIVYCPRVPSSRRTSTKIHYVATENAARTLCGCSTDNMDQGCLDDMTLEDALAEKESCKRCIAAMI